MQYQETKVGTITTRKSESPAWQFLLVGLAGMACGHMLTVIYFLSQ